MGCAKATLPFGPEVMLTRILRLLGEVVWPVAVVAAPGQALPGLPAGVQLVHDRARGRGPLEGLCCGMLALADRVEAAFVTSCDVPLLRGELVRYLCGRIDGHDVVVPCTGGFCHPLSAVYRTSLVDAIDRRLAREQLRLVSLYGEVRTCRVAEEELRLVDPELNSLLNVNGPEDYRAALQLAGIAAGGTGNRSQQWGRSETT
jgi:molybdopterin-guanine dinucleotide biosynthesis protein A